VAVIGVETSYVDSRLRGNDIMLCTSSGPILISSV